MDNRGATCVGARSVSVCTAGSSASERPARRRSRLRSSVALAALLAAPGLAAAADETASIPLHDSFDGSGFYNTIKVTVGNGPESRVLVDTGSTGLYIREDKAGPDISLITDGFAPVSFTYGYSSGNYLSGYYATGIVAFPEANVTLATGPITFGLVTSITCTADKPDCPGWANEQAGVMGVAYSALPQGEFNPLAQLGGNYGTGFLFISNDQANPNVDARIVVGLTAENIAGFTWAPQFTAEDGGQPAGLKAWNTKTVYTCFSVNAGSPGCYDSIFDSGAEKGTFETGTSGDATGKLPHGSAVNTTVPGVISFSNVSGDQANLDQYAYEPPHGGSLGYNTGASVFRYYVVAYDAINGRIGFAPLQNVLLGTIDASTDADLGVAGGGVYLGGKLVMMDGLTTDRPIVLGTGASLDVQGLAALNGSLSGTDDVKVSMVPGAKLALGGVSTYSEKLHVVGGELNVNGYLPADIQLDGATLSGAGTVGSFAAAKDSTVAPGNSVGTLHVLGDAAFAPNATYSVQLGPDVTSDQIVLGGTLYAAGTVGLSLDGATATVGQSYRIATAALGIEGAFDQLDAPDFGTLAAVYPFVAPELVYGADTIDVAMTRSGIAFSAAATTRNQAAIAEMADSTGFDNAAVTALTGLNLGTAPAAFDALAGDFYPTLDTVIQQQSIYVRNAAGARLRQAFGPAKGPKETAGLTTSSLGTLAPTFWVQGVGGWGNLSSDGNAGGASSSIGGVLFGADTSLGDLWRVGVLGGVNRSWVSSDSQPASATMDNYDTGLYAGLRQGAFALDLGAAYSWHDISSERTVVFPGFAGNTAGEWTATTAQAFGEASWTFEAGTTRLSPFAGLAYIAVDGGSLTETGSDAALGVAYGNNDVTYSTLGARLAAPFTIGDAKAVAGLTLGWQHAFGDLVPTADMTFAGASTAAGIAGVPIAEDVALVEASLAYQLNASSSLGLRYAGQLATDATQNLVTAQWETRF